MSDDAPGACPDCDGDGGGMYGTSWGACETCHGTGTTPPTRQ